MSNTCEAHSRARDRESRWKKLLSQQLTRLLRQQAGRSEKRQCGRWMIRASRSDYSTPINRRSSLALLGMSSAVLPLTLRWPRHGNLLVLRPDPNPSITGGASFSWPHAALSCRYRGGWAGAGQGRPWLQADWMKLRCSSATDGIDWALGSPHDPMEWKRSQLVTGISRQDICHNDRVHVHQPSTTTHAVFAPRSWRACTAFLLAYTGPERGTHRYLSCAAI